MYKRLACQHKLGEESAERGISTQGRTAFVLTQNLYHGITFRNNNVKQKLNGIVCNKLPLVLSYLKEVQRVGQEQASEQHTGQLQQIDSAAAPHINPLEPNHLRASWVGFVLPDGWLIHEFFFMSMCKVKWSSEGGHLSPSFDIGPTKYLGTEETWERGTVISLGITFSPIQNLFLLSSSVFHLFYFSVTELQVPNHLLSDMCYIKFVFA